MKRLNCADLVTTLSVSMEDRTADSTDDNLTVGKFTFVEDLLDTSTCDVLKVSSDDEFNVFCLGTSNSCD